MVGREGSVLLPLFFVERICPASESRRTLHTPIMPPRRATSPARKQAPSPAKTSSVPASKRAKVVWGDYVAHSHSSGKNILNAVLCAVVLVPSIIAASHLYSSCSLKTADTYGARIWTFLYDSSPSPLNRTPFLVLDEWCKIAMNNPFSFANALFFLNVTVGFWLIGLVQRSFWLIDPYWTLIPPLLGHLYQCHPKAQADPTRSAVVLGLLWVWSLRLTHSYFRREEWKFGQREDVRRLRASRISAHPPPPPAPLT